MLFPIPYEDLRLRRLPWVTWGLIAVWIVGFGLWKSSGAELRGGLGWVPAEPQLQGFAMHWMLHAGWAHLASVVLLLLLVGPALEALWGPAFFGAFFLASAFVSGAAYQLGAGDSMRPFIGSSGAIASLMGAFALRFFKPGVWYTAVGWWRGAVHKRFWVPAYPIAGVWFACEVAMQLAGPAESATRGVTYAGQISGALMGIAVVFAMQRFDLEQRWLGILPEGAPHPALAAAEQALETDGPAAAVALLKSAAREAPDDAAIVRMLCEQACAGGEPSAATPVFEPFLRGRLRDGESDVAAALWSDFARHVGRPVLDARLQVALGDALCRRGDRIEAARVLRAAIRAPGFTPGLAMRVVDLVRGVHNGVALAAAAFALDAPQLHEAKRAKLEGIVADLEIAGEIVDDPDLDVIEIEVERSTDRSIDIAPEEDLRAPPPEVGQVPDATSWTLDDDAPSEPNTEPMTRAPAAPASPEFAEREEWVDVDDADLDLALADDVPDTVPILSGLGAVGMSARSERPLPQDDKLRRSLPPTGFDLDDDTDPALEAAAALPRFSDAKRIEVVALAWEPGRIQLQQGSEPPSWLSLTQVEAIATAAVSGIAAKPVIVIDLLLNWSALDEVPLRVVRLRSDRFDPTRLRPQAEPGLEAFRAVLEGLLDETGGVPLPDLEGARGLPFRRFDRLDAYEREVLQIDV